MFKIKTLMNKKFNKLFNSFRAKTIAISITSLMLAMILMIVVSYKGVKLISKSSLSGFERSLDATTSEYLDNYITTSAKFMEDEIYGILKEQAILGDLSQKIIDHDNDFRHINQLLVEIDYFKDVLHFNGRWYQNDPSEPSVLLVQRYLLDGQNKIRPEVKKLIDRSILMDYLLPSFKEHGVVKQWVYYTGPEGRSFMRVAPWVDIGTAVDQIYPEYTDEPNWSYFNPGLIKAWQAYIQDQPILKEDTSRLAIVLPPSQDGGTGEMIMTVRHPLWNLERDTFNGAISYDVSLNSTLATIEDIRLGRSGFAFIADEDRNVITINEMGMRTLGLEKLEISDAVTGYNRLERQLDSSVYENVQKLVLPTARETRIEEVLVNNEDLIIVQKRFLSGLAFSKERGIYQNYWTLGFVVPKDEFYDAFYTAEVDVEKTTNKILGYQFLLSVVTLLLMAALIFDFNRNAVTDLEKLLEVTEEIKKRNYDVEIDIHSNDEFGRLALAFKSMIAEIKLTVQQLFDQNQLFKEEIDERKRKERIIDYLESYDSLTNLPNQGVFKRTIDEQVQLIRGSGKIGAVLVLGLDNFRRVNEAYSHSVGDEILKIATERFSRELRNVSIVAKLNGDEFGFVMNHLNDVQELVVSVEQVIETFEESFKIDNGEIFMTASVGISTFPADGFNSEVLFKNASSALVNAKETGRSTYKFFDNEMNQEAKEKMELLTDLRYAIEDGEFVLNYQPIIHVETRAWIGMEALIRWNSPTRGMVPPNKFIPLAEEANLIGQISHWVIKKACGDLKVLHDNGFEGFRVSVNISPNELKEEGFVETIMTMVTEADIPPNSLSLEITEGVFIGSFGKTTEIFKRLRQFGIKISVDDFGTGYSSLSYIKKLPVNSLKIDQSFIRSIPNEDEGTIANIIVILAQALNLKVVAEGVETEEQLKFLEDRGVEEAQGYYFSTPLTIEQLSLGLIEYYKSI